jgi:hypothetical protein
MSATQQVLLAGSTAVLWTPANLAVPPHIWLDDTTAVTGSPASNWASKGSLGAGFQQGTGASQPTVNASGLDGKRTLTFDGTADYMFDPSNFVALFRNQTNGWCFLLFRRTALDGASTGRVGFVNSINSSVTTTRFGLFLGGAAGVANRVDLVCRRLDADSAGVLAGPTIADTNWHCALATMNWSTGAATLAIDGDETPATGTITSTGSTSNTDSATNGTALAAFTGLSFSNVEIAELIVGRTLPSDPTERDKLNASRLWYWGLEANLPSGHPYESAPPTV